MYRERSLPQMPHASTLRRASDSETSGRAKSAISSLRGPVKIAARADGLVLVTSLDRFTGGLILTILDPAFDVSGLPLVRGDLIVLGEDQKLLGL